MRSWLGAAVLLLLAGCGEEIAAPAQGTAQGPEAIAFQRDQDVAVMHADGSGLRTLAKGLTQPAWSPDGQHVVAASEAGLRVVGLDGRVRRLTEAEETDSAPAWSSDGRTIVFARRHPHGAELWAVDAGGGQPRRLVEGGRGVTDSDPELSPDGRTIAFTRYTQSEKSGIEIAVMTVAATGGEPRRLGEGARPAWSPDGARIAFASGRDGNGQTCFHDCSTSGEIYVMDAGGGDARRVTRDPASDSDPEWVGDRILFTSDRNYMFGDSYEIYATDVDGSCVTQLTWGGPWSRSARWRPGAAAAPWPCGRRLPAYSPPERVGAGGMPWLGPRFQGLLLADSEPGLLRYDDCDPDAGACPGRVQLQRERACRRFQLDAPERRVRYHARAGALVSESGGMLTVYTGPHAVPVFVEAEEDLRAELLRGLLGALRPQRGPRLAPPRLPAKVLARLAETERRVKRLGRAGARRSLRIGPQSMENRLALSRILRRLHGRTPRATRC